MKRLVNGLLAGLFAAACFCTPTGAEAAEKSAGKYVMDFSGSQNHGVSGGNFNNFAFKLDLHQAETKMSVPYGDQHRPDLVATYDYADCTPGQEFILEKPLRDLAPGDAAWVDYVDVEMIPFPQRGLKWAGGVCYGYREPGGKWHWNLTATPLTYDKASDRVRAHISVQRGPIDALKLVFDYSVPRQSVSNVTFTTRAIGATPDPPFRPK
jgi:hypothetical protein